MNDVDLSPAGVLALWDEGGADIPAVAATRLLRRLGVDPSAMTVGQADRALLDLHARLVGPAVEGVAECPECGEVAEMALEIADLSAPVADPGSVIVVEEGDWRVRVRPPRPDDVVAVAGAADVAQARAALLRRVVLDAGIAAQTATADDLPEPVIARIAAALEQADPQAAPELMSECPACSAEIRVALDPARHLSAALGGAARRLLGEVDALARAYGWLERDILSLSPSRRRAYLELVG